MTDTQKKLDANQLLQNWQGRQVDQGDQAAEIERLLNNAQPYVLLQAFEAGALSGNARTDAFKRIGKMIRKLDAEDLRVYRKQLTQALGITTAEFNDLARKPKGKGADEDDERDLPIVFTLGGWVGKGEKKWFLEYCFDSDRHKGIFAYRDPEGKIDTADELIIDNVRYVPVKPEEDLMVAKQVVVFPKRVAMESHSGREIAVALTSFLRRMYLFDDIKMPKLAAYFIMQTWLYDNFKALCYLRAIGDKGAGKSELMRRIGHLCYRMTKSSGADSVSTFFRTTTTYKGTVFFEEADLPEGSGADNPIVKFINLGAMQGNYILRSEEYIREDGSRGFRTTPFETYCPKLFAQRNDYDDDAVASRSLTIKVIGKSTQELLDFSVPLEMNAAYWAEWDVLTSRLLRWRLEKMQEALREMQPALFDPLVSPRMNQVTAAVKAIAAEDNDQEFLNEVRDVLRALYEEETLKRSTLVEARVVEALWKCYIYPDLRKRFEIREDGRIMVKIGDIAAIANNIIDEMNAEGSDLRTAKEEGDGKKKKSIDISAQRVGKIVRDVLQLHQPPRHGKGFFCVWDDVKMEIAGMKYGVLPDKAKIEDARKAVTALNAATSTRAPMQMGLDAGEIDDEQVN